MLLTPSGKRLYVANANRNTVTVIDLEAGRPIETIGTAIDPERPGRLDAQLAGADGRRVDAVRGQRRDERRGRGQRQGARREQAAGLHPDRLVPDLRPAREGRQDPLRDQRQGDHLEGQPRRPEPARSAATGSTRAYIAGLFQGTLARIPLPGPSEMVAYTKTVYECSPLRSRDARAAARGAPDPGEGRRAVADHARRLHHQGEPDLRPGPRRHARGQRRPVDLPLRRGRHAQPPRPGPGVRPARQLLRRRRGQRRRPRVVDGGVRDRLRREDLAADRTGATAACRIPPRGRWRSPGPRAATSGTAPRRRG